MWLIIIWITLVLFVLALNYSASKNNESYDSYVLQQRRFDELVDSEFLVFARYIGDDKYGLKHGQYECIAISTTDDNKIVVEFDDELISYDDFEHFNCDWRFKN